MIRLGEYEPAQDLAHTKNGAAKNGATKQIIRAKSARSVVEDGNRADVLGTRAQ